MTTITNNKLTEWRKALNSAVENYQSTQAWYEENPDNPAAEQDMDAAEGDIEKLLKQYGVLIVLSLMDEIDELQELRHSCLALRGEIEDVQAQLYEAENRNNADDEELQERRKADSAEPVYQYRIRNGYNGQVTEWQTIRRDQVDFILKMQPLNAEFQIVAAPTAPVVPDDGRAEFEAWMLKKWGRERQEYDFAMGKFLHGENYADSYTRHMWKAWTESRAAMLQSKYRDLSQPVDPQISEYEKIMLQAGNSPVIPDGYALVPVEPTDEMIAAAMNCEDVLFNSDESFCVQFGNIYEAMLAAAPQQEGNNG